MQINLASETVATVPQAARHFKISPAKAWKLVLSGQVPSVKIGSSRRVTLESFARSFQSADAGEGQQ